MFEMRKYGKLDIRDVTGLVRNLLLALMLLFIVGNTSEKKPNIVFVLGDDINQDSWGTYGNIDCKTPNIDKLAVEGMKFNSAYCSMAMCAPFRHELYSGRTPWRTQTMFNHSGAVPETKSWPHYLEPLGYRVALMGKKHVVPGGCYPFENLNKGGPKKKSNEWFIQQTTQFIDSSTEQDKPFCLVIASSDAHLPFTSGDPSAYKADELTIPPYWLDTPELREVLVTYYAEVTNFDSLVGDVRSLLETKNIWDNTVFFVCGEQGTRLPLAKWTCYDNGLRSGLIAHWKGVTPPGSVVDELIATLDIGPTLVEIAGGTVETGAFDGFSIFPTLKGEKQVVRDYVYGAFTNVGIAGSDGFLFPIRVIRNREYSFIYNPNYTTPTTNAGVGVALKMLEDKSYSPKKPNIVSSWVELGRKDPAAQSIARKLTHRPEYELYHLSRDPYELKNEIDNPEYKKVSENMKAAMMKKLNELGDGDPIATEEGIRARKAAKHGDSDKKKKKKEKKKNKKNRPCP
ncbi:MAG: sulfatase [Planctomycetes bacterium]|nr:sulfatase [Planctomycetota bacterium]